MPEYLFDLSIELAGPVISQAAGVQAFGLDAAARRDAEDRPALPGSLIRGNLRAAWGELEAVVAPGEAPDIGGWLGTASQEGSGDAPRRARLHFDPLWLGPAPENPGLIQRTARDTDTGTVRHGALQTIDAPYGPGQSLVFSGGIRASLADDDEARRLARWLRLGVEWSRGLGAFKGVGFGRVLAARATFSPYAAPPLKLAETDGCLLLRLRPDRPLCLARPHRPDDNRFVSEDWIPGGAIKGALANRLKETGGADRWPSLHRHLSTLRIGHALPTGRGAARRPTVLPQSLVSAPAAQGSDAHRLYDVLLRDGPGLIHGEAPAFAIDWKGRDWALAAGLTAGCRPLRSVEVRTAIAGETGRAAEGRLFSMDALEPEGVDWLAEIHLDAIDIAERAALLTELGALLAGGLAPVGKTNARLEVAPLAPAPWSAPSLMSSLAAITLQTDTRLLPDHPRAPAANGGDSLLRAYRDIWDKISDGSLDLVRLFVRHRLLGGGYLHRRFGAVPYNPALLTAAGSVFLLQARPGREAEAQACLDCWVRHGLPAVGPQDWRQNPWLPENGYGEIAVNLPLHWELDPKEAWHELD